MTPQERKDMPWIFAAAALAFVVAAVAGGMTYFHWPDRVPARHRPVRLTFGNQLIVRAQFSCRCFQAENVTHKDLPATLLQSPLKDRPQRPGESAEADGRPTPQPDRCCNAANCHLFPKRERPQRRAIAGAVGDA